MPKWITGVVTCAASYDLSWAPCAVKTVCTFRLWTKRHLPSPTMLPVSQKSDQRAYYSTSKAYTWPIVTQNSFHRLLLDHQHYILHTECPSMLARTGTILPPKLYDALHNDLNLDPLPQEESLSCHQIFNLHALRNSHWGCSRLSTGCLICERCPKQLGSTKPSTKCDRKKHIST